MRREWSPEELIESWTLLGPDWTLVGNKSGATRLSFALLLKFFEIEARFGRPDRGIAAGPGSSWRCSCTVSTRTCGLSRFTCSSRSFRRAPEMLI